MRYLILLRQILLDASSVFGVKCDSCNSYTTIFKDNKGVIELAKEPKYIPRKKCLSITCNHSLDYIIQVTSKIF